MFPSTCALASSVPRRFVPTIMKFRIMLVAAKETGLLPNSFTSPASNVMNIWKTATRNAIVVTLPFLGRSAPPVPPERHAVAVATADQ